MYVMRPCPQLEHLRSTYIHTHTHSGCHVLAVPLFSVMTYTNPLLDMFGQPPPAALCTGTCKHHTDHGLAFSSSTTLRLATHPFLRHHLCTPCLTPCQLPLFLFEPLGHTTTTPTSCHTSFQSVARCNPPHKTSSTSTCACHSV